MPHANHHLCIPPTNRDAKIWRYLDFPQVAQLLKRDELFFTRADQFDDPFEGTLPEKHREYRQLSNDIPDEWADELLPKFRKICTKSTYISCWHISNSESATMWDRYLEANHGVCIQSTFQKLIDSISIHSKDEIYASEVRYIDYETDHLAGWRKDTPLGNSISPFIHKRDNFENESELRAIIHSPSWRDSSGESYITAETIEEASVEKETFSNEIRPVDIDLDELIEKIHISPDAGDWVEGLLQDIAEDYGLNSGKVGTSGMTVEPGY